MKGKYSAEVDAIYTATKIKRWLEKRIQIDHPNIYVDIIDQWFLHHQVKYLKFVHAIHHYLTGDIFVCEYGNYKSIRVVYSPTMCKSSCRCVKEKRESTLLSKYGVKTINDIDGVREKMKQTNISRYGVEYASQAIQVKNKMKATNKERYGTEYSSQNEEVKSKVQATMRCNHGVEGKIDYTAIQAKMKKTNIAKYGEEYATQSEQVKEHTKDTVFKKYGVGHISQAAAIKEQIKQSNVEKYGYEHILQMPSIREQSKQTSMRKYGVEFPSQSFIMQDKVKATLLARYGEIHPLGLSLEIVTKLLDADHMTELYNSGGVKVIGETYGISDSTVNIYLRKCGMIRCGSTFEKEVVHAIRDKYMGTITTHNRDILDGKEIDIYLPDLNLAIECNGSFWHSELNGKDKSYHINKTVGCEKKNIRLIHIWEHDWYNSRDKMVSLLSTVLGGISNKIPARKCEIVEVTGADTKVFLDKNHRQSNVNSSIKYGLLYEGNIVAIMTFGVPRFATSFDFELLRYCTLLGHAVIGGASKLLAHFIKKHSPTTMISYSDRTINTGNMYQKLGFSLLKNSPPSYHYTKDYLLFENRMKFQKHKLSRLLPEYISTLTEWENMQLNGYDRIWDCGNSVWEWNIDSKKSTA